MKESKAGTHNPDFEVKGLEGKSRVTLRRNAERIQSKSEVHSDFILESNIPEDFRLRSQPSIIDRISGNDPRHDYQIQLHEQADSSRTITGRQRGRLDQRRTQNIINQVRFDIAREIEREAREKTKRTERLQTTEKSSLRSDETESFLRRLEKGGDLEIPPDDEYKKQIAETEQHILQTEANALTRLRRGATERIDKIKTGIRGEAGEQPDPELLQKPIPLPDELKKSISQNEIQEIVRKYKAEPTEALTKGTNFINEHMADMEPLEILKNLGLEAFIDAEDIEIKNSDGKARIDPDKLEYLQDMLRLKHGTRDIYNRSKKKIGDIINTSYTESSNALEHIRESFRPHAKTGSDKEVDTTVAQFYESFKKHIAVKKDKLGKKAPRSESDYRLLVAREMVEHMRGDFPDISPEQFLAVMSLMESYNNAQIALLGLQKKVFDSYKTGQLTESEQAKKKKKPTALVESPISLNIVRENIVPSGDLMRIFKEYTSAELEEKLAEVDSQMNNNPISILKHFGLTGLLKPEDVATDDLHELEGLGDPQKKDSLRNAIRLRFIVSEKLRKPIEDTVEEAVKSKNPESYDAYEELQAYILGREAAHESTDVDKAAADSLNQYRQEFNRKVEDEIKLQSHEKLFGVLEKLTATKIPDAVFRKSARHAVANWFVNEKKDELPPGMSAEQFLAAMAVAETHANAAADVEKQMFEWFNNNRALFADGGRAAADTRRRPRGGGGAGRPDEDTGRGDEDDDEGDSDSGRAPETPPDVPPEGDGADEAGDIDDDEEDPTPVRTPARTGAEGDAGEPNDEPIDDETEDEEDEQAEFGLGEFEDGDGARIAEEIDAEYSVGEGNEIDESSAIPKEKLIKRARNKIREVSGRVAENVRKTIKYVKEDSPYQLIEGLLISPLPVQKHSYYPINDELFDYFLEQYKDTSINRPDTRMSNSAQLIRQRIATMRAVDIIREWDLGGMYDAAELENQTEEERAVLLDTIYIRDIQRDIFRSQEYEFITPRLAKRSPESVKIYNEYSEIAVDLLPEFMGKVTNFQNKLFETKDYNPLTARQIINDGRIRIAWEIYNAHKEEMPESINPAKLLAALSLGETYLDIKDKIFNDLYKMYDKHKSNQETPEDDDDDSDENPPDPDVGHGEPPNNPPGGSPPMPRPRNPAPGGVGADVEDDSETFVMPPFPQRPDDEPYTDPRQPVDTLNQSKIEDPQIKQLEILARLQKRAAGIQEES